MLSEDEINAEKVVPGPHSDLFSIGATCFSMMTGRNIWDALLEKRFVSRSQGPRRVDGAFIQESWRYHSWTERMNLLEPLLQGDESVFDILPNFYSQELRDLVVELLNLDREMGGESATLADEVEEGLAAKCAVTDGRELQGMRRIWRAMTRRRSGRRDARMAVAESRQQFDLRWLR